MESDSYISQSYQVHSAHSPLDWPKPAILCLTPDDFTRQWGTPRSQWVNHSLDVPLITSITEFITITIATTTYKSNLEFVTLDSTKKECIWLQ